MHNYTMGFREVLSLPVKTFWMLHKNVDRIHAENDQRQILVVLNAFNGGDGLTNLLEQFRKRIGKIVETDEPEEENSAPKLDETGLMQLKGLGSL